ncbi:MAG: thioredoxin family protein [Muribaculum sp.]|nr:thioredoxin family protein [Muribaculum sp.]
MKKLLYAAICATVMSATGCQKNNTGISNPEDTVGANEELVDEAVATAEATDSVAGRPIELGPDDILEFGAPQPVPVVVDFSASWCGPCQQMHPTFNKVARMYHGRVNFIYVDIDKAPQIAKEYGIEAVPTLLFVNTKGDINRQVGAMSEDAMIGAVEAIIAESPQPTGKAPR